MFNSKTQNWATLHNERSSEFVKYLNENFLGDSTNTRSCWNKITYDIGKNKIEMIAKWDSQHQNSPKQFTIRFAIVYFYLISTIYVQVKETIIPNVLLKYTRQNFIHKFLQASHKISTMPCPIYHHKLQDCRNYTKLAVNSVIHLSLWKTHCHRRKSANVTLTVIELQSFSVEFRLNSNFIFNWQHRNLLALEMGN